MNINHLIADVDLRFKSANAVPVTRASITKEEWGVMRAAILVMANIAAGTAEEITFHAPEPPQ